MRAWTRLAPGRAGPARRSRFRPRSPLRALVALPLRLEVAGGDDLAAAHGDQGGEDADVHGLAQEVDRAVAEDGVDAPQVEGVRLVVVGAVDAAGVRARHAVGGEPVQRDVA